MLVVIESGKKRVENHVFESTSIILICAKMSLKVTYIFRVWRFELRCKRLMNTIVDRHIRNTK